MADIQRIIRIYQTMMRNDKQAQSLAEAARDMKAAEKYAERAGITMPSGLHREHSETLTSVQETSSEHLRLSSISIWRKPLRKMSQGKN